MKPRFRKTFPGILLFLTLLLLPIPVQAQTDSSEMDVVSTREELYTWYEEHLISGGEVTLGDTITITDSIRFHVGQVQINTGRHGLIYDGGAINGDNLTITGEGVDTPVVDIYAIDGWNMSLISGFQAAHITAMGRDGIGGTAVRISKPEQCLLMLEYASEGGLIQSFGKGAIGVYLDVPIDLACTNIYVEGEGSTAVYAVAGTNLFYCRLNAQGPLATTVSGNGEISLNNCTAIPASPHMKEMSYAIVEAFSPFLYEPVQQYSEDVSYFNYLYTFLFQSEDGQSYYTDTFEVEWTPDPNSLSTDVVGQIILQGTILSPFPDLLGELQFPLELVIDIRDPDIPCIAKIKHYDALGYVRIDFWKTYDPKDEQVILWRSDDGGITWYDYTNAADLQWDQDSVFFYYSELTTPILFKLEEIGVGESNTMMIAADRNTSGSIGGDRTGTDRVIKYRDGVTINPTPPAPEPDLETKPWLPESEDEKLPKPEEENQTGNSTEILIPIYAKQLVSLASSVTDGTARKDKTASASSSRLPDDPGAVRNKHSKAIAEDTDAASEDTPASVLRTTKNTSGIPLIRLFIVLTVVCAALLLGVFFKYKQTLRKG